MMTSSNGNIFCVTGPLRGESTGHRWISLTKASDAELWCFLWYGSEWTVEYTIVRLENWDVIATIMTSQWCQCTSLPVRCSNILPVFLVLLTNVHTLVYSISQAIPSIMYMLILMTLINKYNILNGWEYTSFISIVSNHIVYILTN